MNTANLLSPSSEIQERTMMQYRAIIVGILVPMSWSIWLGAFRLFDTMSPFAVPVIIGCAIASGRRREPISEQNAEP